jgi:hypothetical protein
MQVADLIHELKQYHPLAKVAIVVMRDGMGLSGGFDHIRTTPGNVTKDFRHEPIKDSPDVTVIIEGNFYKE